MPSVYEDPFGPDRRHRIRTDRRHRSLFFSVFCAAGDRGCVHLAPEEGPKNAFKFSDIFKSLYAPFKNLYLYAPTRGGFWTGGEIPYFSPLPQTGRVNVTQPTRNVYFPLGGPDPVPIGSGPDPAPRTWGLAPAPSPGHT